MENLDHLYSISSSNHIIHHNNDPDLLENYRKEIKQLKSMLILYLDLIQEQSDQIVAKDKQLVKYKSENETLRQKLEKFINTLNSDYFIPSPAKNSPATNDENRDKNGATVNKIVLQRVSSSHHRNVIKIKKEPDQPNPTIISSIQYTDYEESKEKTEIVASKTPEFEPLSPSNDIKLEVDDDDDEDDNSTTAIICPQENEDDPNVLEETIPIDDESTRRTPIKIVWQNTYDMPKKMIVLDDIVQVEEKAEQNFNQSQNENANSNCSTSGGNASDNSESNLNLKKAYRNSFIISNEPYITQNWKDEIINADIEKLYHNEAAELEVPCWKVIEDSNDSPFPEPSLENISDEAYFKRHSKLEIDERRRKKWDVQRIREQKTIERLKKRHLKELFTDNEPKIITSFYPSSDMIKYIQITDEIPVQAFGESIPLLPKTNFYLPWRPVFDEKNSGMQNIGRDLTDASGNFIKEKWQHKQNTNLPPLETSPLHCENQSEVKTKFLHRLDHPILHRQQKFTKRAAKKSD